jgi:hypothetical protein
VARAKQSWLVSDAHDDAVTSIVASSSTSSSNNSSNSPATTRLVTGTSRGVIQQWQVWETSNAMMIQYWPKLPTQKLPQQMHFMATNTERTQAIQWLQILPSENDNKNNKNNPCLILSATDTDICAWNAVTGKQVFGMHGWLDPETPLRSNSKDAGGGTSCWLQTPRRLLSTVGPWVCVHDFAHAQEFGTDDDDYDSDAAQDYLAGL